jgi:rod shape-determining protein MreD
LLLFTVPTQALQVLPLFILAHSIILVVRLVVGGGWPGWSLVLSPLLEALLWPVVSVLLLLPQRRAPDPDKTRPL